MDQLQDKTKLERDIDEIKVMLRTLLSREKGMPPAFALDEEAEKVIRKKRERRKK